MQDCHIYYILFLLITQTIMTNFPSHIFKAYDIRGLVNGELSEEFAYALGQAFVKFLEERDELSKTGKVVVGYDMRGTSPKFALAIRKAVVDSGVDVVDIGLVSTPLFNFACAHYTEHSGGIMVTASHNPAEYNGFKITLGNGLPVGKATGMDRLKELVEIGAVLNENRVGKEEQLDVYPDYEQRIFGLVAQNEIKPLKVVIDAGNGMAKVSFSRLMPKLPVKVEYLFLEPDGNFPNHESNPLKGETLKDLQKKVVESGADFGFALDGDADRIGLVDETGAIVPASFVGGLVGLEYLKTHPGALMLYDLRCSSSVKEIWEAAGAKTAMCKVGHANIKKMMKETGASFASELSLHLYYSEMYDVESSDLSFLYIAKILSQSEEKLSALWQKMNKYFHSGEINFEVDDKDGALKKLKERYVDAKISELDGLSFAYPDFWFNVRSSNTEPLLRLNLEAKNEKLMEEKLIEIKQIIKN